MGATIQEWLKLTNTGDPLRDSGVAQAALAQALATSANLGNQSLRDTTDKIKEINTLSDLLRSKRPTSTTDKGPALSAAEQKQIIALMKVYCPKVDTTEASSGSLLQSTVESWLASLQGAVGDLQTDASQQTTMLQKQVNGYENHNTSASSTFDKNGRLGEGIAHNVSQ